MAGADAACAGAPEADGIGAAGASWLSATGGAVECGATAVGCAHAARATVRMDRRGVAPDMSGTLSVFFGARTTHRDGYSATTMFAVNPHNAGGGMPSSDIRPGYALAAIA